MIEDLDVSKYRQKDDIPNKIIKLNSDIFIDFLYENINKCITSLTFPNKLKLAEVIPLFKKDDRTCKSNYRPISILPNLSKIYEKCLYDQMSDFFEQILSNYQFGFRKGISAQQCLMVFIEKWKNVVDQKGVFCALLTDLSKAFDSLNHELLIAKLHNYGFQKTSLKLIHSYLTNRKQSVRIGNVNSSTLNITTSVPQGSILGPLLFLIYINDISDGLESNVKMFADDTSIFSVVFDASSTATTLNNDLLKIQQWAYQWKMSFNPDPSKQAHEVIFSEKHSKPNHPYLFFNQQQVLKVSNQKHLGIDRKSVV